MLLTRCYYHRGARLNATKRVCPYSLLCSHRNVLTIVPCDWVDAQKVNRGLDAFVKIFLETSGLGPIAPSCVQYNGGFSPDIMLLTRCYYHRGARLNATKRVCPYSLLCSHRNVLTIVPRDWVDAQKVYRGLDAFVKIFLQTSGLGPIAPSCVQYNGGFSPDIMLLTRCYYHRGARLNATKRVCPYSLLCSHRNVLTIVPRDWVDAQKVYRGLDAFVKIFLETSGLGRKCLPKCRGKKKIVTFVRLHIRSGLSPEIFHFQNLCLN